MTDRTLRLQPILVAVLLCMAPGCAATRSASGDDDQAQVAVHKVPEVKGEETAVLTAPPKVPPPITRTHATKVLVHLDVEEKIVELADGVRYSAWTFGGTVPGSFIRVRQGDLVEIHLTGHKSNKLPHNIDLHAVTGPGGGASATMTMPGGESVFSFTALNAGLFVYHCALSPAPMHIANGMYGLILVEPPGGLPPVDREYQVMQSEFYTPGKFGDAGLQSLDMNKGIAETPTYIVFNGRVGSLTGDRALTANVGERVRLFVGNGGPNLVSSFHVIGEVFDHVYSEGGTRPTQHNVQTTLVPPGGSAIVDFALETSGEFVLVDHAIFRAFNKGTMGILRVSGAANPAVFKPIKGIAVPGTGH